MTNTEIATIQCAKDYAIVFPWVIRMDNNKHYEPKPNKNGYPAISFRRRKLGITQKVDVHRIVAFQKYGMVIFQVGVQVRHKDNYKLNFRPENILIGTALDNHKDNSKEIISAINAGQKKGVALLRKFKKDQVMEIIRLRKHGLLIREIAKEMSCANSTICGILKNKFYKDFTESEQAQPLGPIANGIVP